MRSFSRETRSFSLSDHNGQEGLTQQLEFNSTGAVMNDERTFTAKFEVLGSSTASQLGRCSR